MSEPKAEKEATRPRGAPIRIVRRYKPDRERQIAALRILLGLPSEKHVLPNDAEES